MANNSEKKLNPSANALYNMFLEEYINFGYAYGGALSESSLCKSFTMDEVNDLLAQHLIQKQEKGEITGYELTLFEKKKLLEDKNLVDKWSMALGTTLLCDRELSRVYGKGNPQIDQLIFLARNKNQQQQSLFLQKHDLSL